VIRSRALRIALQVAFSVGLIALVMWRADLGRVGAAVRALSPGWFALALALNIAITPLMAYRWQVLILARARRDVPLSFLTGTYFVALLVGQVLPTAVGGDAVRIVDLSRRTGATVDAVSSVVVDRVLGTLAVVVLAAAGAFFGGGGLATSVVLPLEVGLMAALALTAFALLSPRARPLLRLLVPLARRLRIEGPSRSLYESLHAYNRHGGALLWVGVLAAVAQVLKVCVIALLARGMGLQIGFGTLLLLGPVLFLVTMVPISLNGVGLREATFVVLLSGVGVPREDAFVLGLAFFAVGVLTAALGGVVLLWRGLRAHRLRAGAETGESAAVE
jgi:uncharacterized membrane protein YbhN (UPF0104 family)